MDLLPPNISEQEIKSLPLCDSCERAKFTKRRIHRMEQTTTAKGESVSTDMKGPFRVKGIHGERFYQGFIDKNSKYLHFRCFATKSTAPNNLEEIMQEPLYRGRLNHYHSDGAPELISKEIAKLCRPRGIRMTFSAPYTSTDNASMERSHRTIFESAHALLLHAGLAIIFWCYAVAHAVYLYNRVPTNTEQGYLAPITAAYGTCPTNTPLAANVTGSFHRPRARGVSRTRASKEFSWDIALVVPPASTY